MTTWNEELIFFESTPCYIFASRVTNLKFILVFVKKEEAIYMQKNFHHIVNNWWLSVVIPIWIVWCFIDKNTNTIEIWKQVLNVMWWWIASQSSYLAI